MLATIPRAGNRIGSRRDSFIQVRQLLAVAILSSSLLGLVAAPAPVPSNRPSIYPAWWFSRGVIAQATPTNASPSWPSNYPASDDYAAINQGQLKNFATGAYNELQSSVPTNIWSTPVGQALASTVTNWSPTTGDNYAGINLGQLKTVAKPFYDVLTQIGYSSGYPWTGSSADDYAAANIGQVKNVFSFDVGKGIATDGVPDWWEILYLGQTGFNGSMFAPNGSGLTLLQCYNQGVNPQQAAPAEPFSVSLSATGPYQAPANIELVANVTYPSTKTIQNVKFYVSAPSGQLLATVSAAPYQTATNCPGAGNYTIVAVATASDGTTASATTQFIVTPSNFYQRGVDVDSVYLSSVIAVDQEKGVMLDETQGTDPNNNFINLFPVSQYPLYPWFLRTLGEYNEPWQHIASVPILSVNNSTGVITTSESAALHVGQKITISNATGETAINGTFLVATVPATDEFTVQTLSGGAVPLSGSYTYPSGSITGATYDVRPTANGATQGGAPPLVAFGSQGGGSPLYANRSYNFGVAAGGQIAFTPIIINSATGGTFTVSSTTGLYQGQTIVISNALGNTAVNGTYLINSINTASNQITLNFPPTPSAPSGTAVSGITGYTNSSASITSADIKIEVYQASSFTTGAQVAPIYTQAFTIPRPANTAAWNTFVSSNFVQDYFIGSVNGNAINFDTQIQVLPAPGGFDPAAWLQQVNYPLMVTHKAANANFYYKISYLGVTAPDDATEGNFGTTVTSNAGDLPMALDSTGLKQAYNLSYTLDFTAASPSPSIVMDTPGFQGTPLPTAYAGQSVDQLIHNAPPVSDTLSPPNGSGVVTVTDPGTEQPVSLNLTQIDKTPELRDQNVLDNFVTSMNNDPMALANYVQNQINLTDAVGYNTGGSIDDISINPQGVSRDALATFLEGQGSPAEQDALLIYLLRKAGYACGYIFPPQDQMAMFDEQLSDMLHMQIRGAEGPSGGEDIPELIPVNYPWVAAYLPVNGTYHWVHLFPWIKDTVVNEGDDLWGYLPNSSTTSGQTFGYQTGGQWVLHYILNDPNIRQLTAPGDSITDDVNTLFPLYVQNQLLNTGVSMSELGTTWYNRQDNYTSWNQFPRPWQTPAITNSNLAMSLTANQNPSNFSAALTNIFDTLSIQVFSDRNDTQGNDTFQSGDPVINTGTLRMADLHDRRFLLYPQVTSTTGTNAPTYNLILSLEAYGDPEETNPSATYYFNANDVNSNGNAKYNGVENPDNASGNPGDLMHQQIADTALITASGAGNDDNLIYQINIKRHIQAQSVPGANTFNPWGIFLGISEILDINDTRYLRKGDMACLCLNYGDVTPAMLEFQAEKYWNYQQTIAANPTTPVNPELAEGQLLYLMGDSYYNKVATFQQNIESWTKTHAISFVANGLTKLSPYRNSDGSPNIINGAVNLRYPRVDMSYQPAAIVGNGTTNLNSGDVSVLAPNSAYELLIAGGSADEHLIIDQFFPQAAAISTAKLLDIAQGWSPTTQIAAHPGTGPVLLSSSNYLTAGAANYPGNNGPGTTTYTHTLEYWCGWDTSVNPTAPPPGSIWSDIVSTLADPTNGPLNTVYVTPGPQYAAGQAGQAFTGIGAFTFDVNGTYGALISDNMVISHGGDGGDVDIPFSDASSDTGDTTIGYDFTENLDLTQGNDGYTINYAGNYAPTAPGYVPNVVDPNSDVNIDTGIGNGTLVLTPDANDNISTYINQTVLSINDPAPSTMTAEQQQQSGGNTGDTSFYGAMQPFLGAVGTAISDPVSSITGEFYVNALDIKLNGPMPLEVRRIYGSLNQAGNNFGYGWRPSYMPYLMLSSDAAYNAANTELTTLPTLIYAGEMDGSVIAYRQQSAGHWAPLASDNPNLVNASNGTIGGAVNPFNNHIDATLPLTGVKVLTLTGDDGSVRTFSVQAYPTPGATSLPRVRPYLQQWTDNRGNYYTFSYGTSTATYPNGDPTLTNYGQLSRVKSSNGDYVVFNYDTAGHIINANAGDGRSLSYQYDTYGDLTQVRLPDSSTIQYAYQHATAPAVAGTAVAGNGGYSNTSSNYATIVSDNGIQITSATNQSPSVLTTSSAHGLHVGENVSISGALGNTAINGTFTVGSIGSAPNSTTLTLLTGATAAAAYSTHLIVQETKPNGRILQNTYSSANNYGARQVLTQSATVGTTQALIQNARFNYGSPTQNSDGTSTGSTIITDVNGNTTTYKYAESEITEVDYPAQNGPETNQASNGPRLTQSWYSTTGSGAYQRSLATVTDRRGLLTNYSYDGNGNLHTLTITGNLTGGTNTGETSTTTMAYNNTTAVNLPGGGSAIPNTLASVTCQVDSPGDYVGTSYVYADGAHPYQPTSISKIASGGTISTNVLQYENVLGGGASAYGLLQTETIAVGSSDQETVQYTYSNNGFPLSETQASETSDPNIVTTFTYDLRGELTSQTDAAGQSTKYSYDALGHQTGAQRYDQWGNLVSWNYDYFNQNGDLEWEQGPRYSPNDYVFLQYDGAGRLSQQVKYLSQALSSGNGVTSYGAATTLYQHDTEGNLTEMEDPNQNATTMSYDADGEMLGRVVHAGSSTGTAVATESMTYEPGGKENTHTSMLGSHETRSYTSNGQLKSDVVLDTTSGSNASSESYLYDLSGRVVRQTLSSGSYWVTTYNDLGRIVTRTFYDSTGASKMVESQTFDRRGNVISKTNVSGNTFTTTYDGLSRIKSTTGPSAGTASGSTTAQQTSFHVYDAAGQRQSVTNAADERTDTFFDAEGRPTLISVFNANGSAAGNTGFWYSPDHQSVVKTVGSGAAGSANPAVTTTTWMDTRGNVVLTRFNDAPGSYQGTVYDAVGNKTGYRDEMGNNTIWTYDALGRVTGQTLPGGAATTFTYAPNSTGETVSRAMPGSLTSKTSYDSAGREIGEELDGTGGSVTRKYTNYTYYGSGTGLGLLESVTDPRGFTTTTTYDAWQRPLTVNSSGSGTTAQATSYTYDNRGMVDSVIQSYGSSATGASTEVTRGYDAYGQMNAETVYVNPSGTTSFGSGNIVSQWAQSWDPAGRRTALNFELAAQGSGDGSQYAYQYNANGQQTQVTNNAANYQYTYGDNGLLTQRVTPYLTQTISQRDPRGRITAESSSVGGVPKLQETMAWRQDDRLASYQLTGGGTGAAEPTRTYGYDMRGQVVTEPFVLYSTANPTTEPLGAATATNFFDQGTLDGPTSFAHAGNPAGLGVRTAQDINTNGFARNQLSAQDNFKRSTLDDSYTPDPTSNTEVEEAPWTLGYDNPGNESSRNLVAGGTTYATQALTWDAYNRLVEVAQTNSGTSDFSWTTVYDGFGRRVQTTWQPMHSGVNYGSPTTFNYYYDPQVEFLELGFNNGGSRLWRVYGPDRSGSYGGAQGIGGLESSVVESSGSSYGAINDYFGNALGKQVSGAQQWYPVSLSGYGPIPGGLGLNTSYEPQWRGRYIDYTGFICLGARYYDCNAGHFLSADPAGPDGSMDLYSYCNGDPVNGLDPDGRFVSGFAQTGANTLTNLAQGLDTLSGAAAYGYTSLYSPNLADQLYGPREDALVPDLTRLGGAAITSAELTNPELAISDPSFQSNAEGMFSGLTGGGSGNSISYRTGATFTNSLLLGVPAADGAGTFSSAAEGAGAIRAAPPGIAGWTEDGSALVGGTFPRNAGLAGTTHPVTGIPFNAQGFPVFDSVAVKTVQIEYTGTRAGDFAAANAKAEFTETPQGFTWHHVEDGTTMQLVPEDIHAATGHTGGFSLYSQQ